MEFHTFGDKHNKKLLLMHGMLCDWRKFHELLKALDECFYTIYPAMDGCYDGAPDFVSFADECAQSRLQRRQNRRDHSDDVPCAVLWRRCFYQRI